MFACYLLTPQTPTQTGKRSLHMKHTYVGFTMTPKRRLRQHNGEIVQGAKKTAKYRPWDMLIVVYGFASKVQALQFEYVWQHPYNSRFTKTAMASARHVKRYGGMRSVRRKLIELYLILALPPWNELSLTLSFTTPEIQTLAASIAPSELPPSMVTQVATLDTLPHGPPGNDDDGDDDDARCSICIGPFHENDARLMCYHVDCPMRAHIDCAHECFPDDDDDQLHSEKHGYCPYCDNELHWATLLLHASSSTLLLPPAKKKRRVRTASSQSRPEPPQSQPEPPQNQPEPPDATSAAASLDASAPSHTSHAELILVSDSDEPSIFQAGDGRGMDPGPLRVDPPDLANRLLDLPSPTHIDTAAPRPRPIFPGSPIWHGEATSVHHRVRRPRAPPSPPPAPKAVELSVLVLSASMLWVVGALTTLWLVRFPFAIYPLSTIALFVCPQLLFYSLVKALFA
ncbi:hypothetical protein SDRG_08882 [Saprolegnia diclina VS20]|uniref:Structure-specific endonuclease subunit SLX1 homolog n=1 Tax=Saprolegnia diclina (strain VS20) TaxID=1156394 RepID=T0RLX7_SAPDV|nr:hypothetical protein SDRG_08882 [Saprolegnia diclina VS20]EQC33363.1 hypothetical protein SDRG_08882 [Saprolegnia diclina VS20]|eukprot:XP_008613003.1 hypothetical protein SDRG_08882 [Saprolegnia diclina VS20]